MAGAALFAQEIAQGGVHGWLAEEVLEGVHDDGALAIVEIRLILHLRQRQPIFGETRIDNPDSRIGVALAGLKLGRGEGRKEERHERDGRREK